MAIPRTKQLRRHIQDLSTGEIIGIDSLAIFGASPDSELFHIELAKSQ